MAHMSSIVRALEAEGVRLPKIRTGPAVVRAKPVTRAAPKPAVTPAAARRLAVLAAVKLRRAQVGEMWTAGVSVGQIAAKLNMSARAVSADLFQIRRAARVKVSVAKGVIIAARRASVADLSKQGLIALDIAKRLDLPVSTVRADIALLQAQGILMRKIGQGQGRTDRQVA